MKLPWLFPQFSLRSGLYKALKAPIDPVCTLHGLQRDPTTLLVPWSPPGFSQLHRAGTASAPESPLNPETSGLDSVLSTTKDSSSICKLLEVVLKKKCAEGGETHWSILFIPKTESCTPSQVAPNQLSLLQF